MNRDDNKGISNIRYNHLNLPIKITFGSTSTIEYIYNADGVKLEKIVTQGTTVATTKYLQGFQYLNDIIQFFPHAEGFVARQGNIFKYVFQYKDHLGNIRLSYGKNNTTLDPEVIEEIHYYPFGLEHAGYNNNVLTNGNIEAQKYKFQGQERQEELGLNWDSFKYRNYDSAIGRFMSVDPLAEKYSKWTPYAFAGNQVVHSREIEGLEPENDLGDDERENYNSENHGVGFGGAMTDHNYYQDAFPMGGELQEVVIGVNDFNRADESYGYDNGRYEGQEGSEVDEWEGTYFDKDNYGKGANPYSPMTGADPYVALYVAAIISAPILLAEGGIAAFSQMTWGSAAYGIGANTVSQGIANGGDLTKVNIIEALSSAVPGIGPTVAGEYFNLPVSNVMQGNFTPSTPQSFEQGFLQIGGGLFSNKFGNKIDANPIFNKGAAKTYKEMAKFSVETATNVLPSLGN